MTYPPSHLANARDKYLAAADAEMVAHAEWIAAGKPAPSPMLGRVNELVFLKMDAEDAYMAELVAGAEQDADE